MYFVGSGALLERAVKYTIKNDYRIDLVLLQSPGSIEKILLDSKIPYIISHRVNSDLQSILDSSVPSIIFLLNCNTIIDDNLLLTHHSFFNIHNGLVQFYRGIAEVCVFSAICNGEKEYGATLQKLSPFDLIDSGQIVAQRRFPISENESFYTIFTSSLKNCEYLFRENLEQIVLNRFNQVSPNVLGKLYSFEDVKAVAKGTNPKLLKKACNLGPLSRYLPKLVEQLDDTYSISD